MTEKKDQNIESAGLRHRAEERLAEKSGTVHPPGKGEDPPGLLHDEKGVGSTSCFSIPPRAVKIESGALTASEPLSPELMPSSVGKRIPRLLLAEDDPGNRKAIGALFKMSGYNHEFAENGLEAIEMWEKGDYDLILMDVQMPLLDGLKATRAIREKERERGGHTPIVAMTANAFKEDKERCLAAGMDDYIAKPIDINKLFLLIRGIIK